MSANRRTLWLTTDRLALLGLLVFTLFVRGGVLWAMRANLRQDPDAYREIAENLLRHGEFALGKGEPEEDRTPLHATAYRPPLYPIVLSNLPTINRQQVSLAKVAALHLALGVATVWLTWLTARRMFGITAGPEARQEIAPTVRSGIDDQKTTSDRSEGPAPRAAESGAGPPGLDERPGGASTTPTLRSGLVPIGPPGLLDPPILVGLLVACDPILLNQQTLVMTETLAAFLAILALWCLARFDAARSWFNAALAGGAIGLGVLCRPTFLPWLLLVAIAMLFLRTWKWENHERHAWNLPIGWAQRWVTFGFRANNAAVVIVTAAGIISPWAIRNYRVFGMRIVTTTHGGYTLLLGNNRYFFEWLSSSGSGVPWNSDVLSEVLEDNRLFMNWQRWRTPVARELNEVDHDRWCYELAQSEIRDEPAMFARACAYRVGQLWSPLPHKLTADESTSRRLLRYATCAWYCGVYTLAAVGIWRLRWRLLQPPWIWGVLLCLAFTAVHTFYWTNMRMRAPLVPFIALVAAAAIHTSPKRERG